MTTIKIYDLSSLMYAPMIWQLSSGNIQHEEYDGLLLEQYIGQTIKYVHQVIPVENKEDLRYHYFNTVTGQVDTFYYWMISEVIEVLSIDEIINKI